MGLLVASRIRASTRGQALGLLAAGLLFVAGQAGASDVCTCGAGDVIDWSEVGIVSGGAFQCSGGNGQLGPEDHVRIEAGCSVTVTGDILQAETSGGGIEVEAGGVLSASVGDGDRLRLSLGAAGLVCHGDCTLAGAFRSVVGAANDPLPNPWPVIGLEPCAGDCATSPELFCASYPPPLLAPPVDRVRAATDLATGTQDWLCLWDFAKDDHRVSYDDNSCYPVALVETEPVPRVCVDLRQGADSEYPHRLREVFQGVLSEPLPAGGGCGVVLDPASGLVSGDCDATVVRVDALGEGGASAVEADDERVGRFLRFALPNGAPEVKSYKILQTIDCAGAPAAPHVCHGSSADLLVLGALEGVDSAAAAGSTLWIDAGWRSVDTFFVLAPLQVDSATPGDSDSGVDLRGRLDLHGVHFTDLGGGPLGPEASAVVRVGGATVDRWKHVLVRNDTGDFAPNTGVDLVLDGLVGATLEHTVLAANTGHAVLLASTLGANTGLVLEDFSIRHHQDGCFNHSDEAVQPGVTIRRSWCAFIQDDAQSAQWFAWQSADPDATTIEDSGCDACDGGVTGRTIRANSGFFDGWTLRRSLLWAPMGTLPEGEDNELSDITFLGFRGSDAVSAPVLGDRLERSVVRGLAVRVDRALFQGELDVRDVLLRDIVTSRTSGVVVAGDGSRVEGSSFIDFDTVEPSCLAGITSCRVAQEAAKTTDDVRWRRNLIAWTPGRGSFMGQAQRYRAVDALDPPEYTGIAIAYHDFPPGNGVAFAGLTATNVGVPDWSDGPCFEGNGADAVATAVPGLPAETLFGGLGFVDPAARRFDFQPSSAAAVLGCGPSPDEPSGVRGYHYVHARTGLRPELMGSDDDGDGWPETQAPRCDGSVVSDCSDNCPGMFNPSQADADLDGQGDACEPAVVICGLGAELAPILVGLHALARRARRRRGPGSTGPVS